MRRVGTAPKNRSKRNQTIQAQGLVIALQDVRAGIFEIRFRKKRQALNSAA